MNISLQRVLVGVCCLAMSACSTLGSEKSAGVFSSENTVSVNDAVFVTQPEIKNMAGLRILPYLDLRSSNNPYLLGEMSAHVMGLTGKVLLLDRDVAGIATASMRHQFKQAGFAVQTEGTNEAAQFELSGSVKELALNVKDRDEVNITIETSVKDLATGKVIWSASVNEKQNRFAGVAGNSKSDVADYLRAELRVVSRKTVEAVSSLLMAGYPALFNLTPGTKTIAGVTVSTAPIAPVLTPVASLPAVSVPDALGFLSVSSKPARAKVYLDEVYFGLTPLRVEVAVGVHTLMLKQSAYQTVTEKVSVRKAETTELDVQLER